MVPAESTLRGEAVSTASHGPCMGMVPGHSPEQTLRCSEEQTLKCPEEQTHLLHTTTQSRPYTVPAPLIFCPSASAQGFPWLFGVRGLSRKPQALSKICLLS
jgi:hypothetical protein